MALRGPGSAVFEGSCKPLGAFSFGSSFSFEPLSVLPNIGWSNCVVSVVYGPFEVQSIFWGFDKLSGLSGDAQRIAVGNLLIVWPASSGSLEESHMDSVQFKGDSHGFGADRQILPTRGTGIFHDLLQSMGLTLFLIIWTFAALRAFELIPLVGRQLLASRHAAGRLYTWSSVDGYYAFLFWQAMTVFCNGLILELAEGDEHGYSTLGGVQVLLCLFYANSFALLCGITGLLGRCREERSMPRPAPKACSLLAGRRCPVKLRPRNRCQWKVIWFLLLIGGAECVTIGNCANQRALLGDELSVDGADDEHPFWLDRDVAEETILARSTSPQFRGRHSLFCGERQPVFSCSADNRSVEPSPCSCARLDNQYEICAEHDFFPRFGTFEATNAPMSDSGDFLYRNFDPSCLGLSLVQSSAKIWPSPSLSCQIQTPGLPRDRRVQVWFASSRVCQTMPRAFTITGTDLVGLQVPFNELWKDRCETLTCEYTIVRPQPQDFDMNENQLHFLLYVPSPFGELPFLIVKQSGSNNAVRMSYFSCMLPRFDLLGSIRRTNVVETTERVLFLGQRPETLRSGTLLVVQTQLTGLSQMQKDNEDHSLMQSQRPVVHVEPELAHVLNSLGIGEAGVTVWLHTWDRRETWSFVHRRHVLALNGPVRPQILAQWRDFQIRPHAHLVPVRPIEYSASFLLLPVCPESWVGVLATVATLTEYWQGTFIYRTDRFPYVHELFAARLPHVQCVWVTECVIVIGPRVYRWEQSAPIFSGVSLTFVERQPLPRQVVPLVADPNATSAGTSEDVRTADSASSVDMDSLSGCQSFSDDAHQDDVMPQDVTAQSYDTLQQGSDFAEEEEAFCSMQRTVVSAPFVPFAVACERGLPYLKVLRLTRKEITAVWQESGIDLVYEHFRSRENGIREKKIMGWSFSHYGQAFGSPFAAWMRRTGLWATQLLSPFEDEGYREVQFVQVFPQPLMVEIAGNGRGEHDVVVLAFTDETAAEEALPLVVQSELSDVLDTIAIRCPPGCTASIICEILGMGHKCRPPMQAVARFHYGDLIRVFTDKDRIGLPAGALLRLSIESTDEQACSELPEQRPLREHQTLLIPLRDVPVDPVDEQLILMQVQWQMEMNADDTLFQEAARRLYRFEHLFPDGRLQELIQVSEEVARHSDPLKMYLAGHLPFPGTKVFTVHVWAITGEVAAFARAIPIHSDRSITTSLLREFPDMVEAQPFWVMTTEQAMMPLSLRIYPVDMILLTQAQTQAKVRIYLVDVIFAQLPKRVAVIYRPRETLRELTRRIGLESVCDKQGHHCLLRRNEGPMMLEWQMPDPIDQNHGAHFTLEFRLQDAKDRCPVSSRPTSSFDLGQPADVPDEGSFMQTMPNGKGARSKLHLYLRQFSLRVIEATFWVHDSSTGIVQLYPDRCSVNLSDEALDQCRRLWSERGLSPHSRVTLIDPAPVFLVLPRPHAIVDQGGEADCPILCHVTEDGRANLLSVVLPRSYPPTSVSSIFLFALPQHECDSDSECYLFWGRRRYEYWQDIQVQPGSFLRLYEWTTRRAPASSTSCGSDGSDSDRVSWISGYSIEAVIDPIETSGGNTATPEIEQRTAMIFEVPTQVPEEGRRLVPRPSGERQPSGRWRRRHRTGQSIVGRSPQSPLRDEHDQAEQLDESSLMQWLEVDEEVDSEAAPSTDQTTTGGHPSAMVSDYTALACNTDFDWHTTWGAVRSFLCGYHQTTTRAQSQLLVHVIAYRRGATTTCGAYCPTWLLDEQVSICRLTDWCQGFTFPLDPGYTRAFPILVELYQNMPSIVVVQNLEVGVVPLVTEVHTDSHRGHFVMMAQPTEDVSEILDWLRTRTVVRFPFDLTFQQTRANVWDRIEVIAGAVLQVRCRTAMEILNPVQSTTEAGPSLEYYSHSTWSSLPSEQPPADRGEQPNSDEHTLMQLSPPVGLRRICYSHCFQGAPEIGEIDYPRESPEDPSPRSFSSQATGKRRRMVSTASLLPGSI